jgi:hypothetical protein
VAVYQKRCYCVIISNWLQQNFQVLLEIQEGKVLADFAKTPLNIYSNFALCELGTTEWGKDVE